jgi:catechol 2,3-dioxygenase-like lactoylglutathione lyase family enzyme
LKNKRKKKEKMAVAKGACLNHISRESSDVRRLANFYKDIFGFEEIESPKLEFKVLWIKISPDLALHLIERSPDTKLPEGPYSASSPVLDPTHLPRGHHVCFSVSNFDSFVQSLKVSQSCFFFYFLYSCLICLCLFQ